MQCRWPLSPGQSAIQRFEHVEHFEVGGTVGAKGHTVNGLDNTCC